jgi:TrmH family RNA methyltransferase
MLSKAKVKYIKSLQIKKFRKTYGEFVVEGAKSVAELLNSDYTLTSIFITEDFEEKYQTLLKSFNGEVVKVKQKDLEELGTFSSNNAALAVVKIKENTPLYLDGNEYVLVLDEVKDPGNLGTIIRIADWYGIKKIICSNDSADIYNPKVISSSMGSFTRMQVYYCSLKEYFSQGVKEVVYGATLEGANVHQVKFAKKGFLIMGNESSGIHADHYSFITEQISIPRLGNAESLNVGVATAIICDNIFRS